MTDTAERTSPSTDAVAEVTAWLEENWDPDLTVAEWWERLGLSGWAAPGLPENAYGKGLNRNDSVAVQNAIAEFGALGAPGGLGLLLAAPDHRHPRHAGADRPLRPRHRHRPEGVVPAVQRAGRRLRPRRPAEQGRSRTATSGSSPARRCGPPAARSPTSACSSPAPTPTCPKHQGITYFAIDMHQKGIEIRPLVEMTGHAMFNEVFMEEAVVPDSALIGGLNNGWAVANTTLMNERAGLGSGGGHAAASAATPGTVVNDLAKRAGDFVVRRRAGKRRGGGGGAACSARSYKLLVELAKGNGKINDPTVRQDLMKLHTLNELGRFNNLRAKAAKAIGQDVPGPAEHLQALDERDRAPAARRRPAHPRPVRHAPRLQGRGPGPAQRGHRQPVRRRWSPAWRCSPRPRRSTAAPTRCSATSSASASSASPRRPTTTRRPPSRTSPRTPDRPFCVR